MEKSNIIDEKKDSARIIGYFILFFAVFFLYFYLRGVNWREDICVHIIVETVFVSLSFLIGAFSLIRYYAGGSNAFFLYGIGFFGAFFLDLFHVLLVTFGERMIFYSEALAEWSSEAAYYFLLVFIWISWMFCRNKCEFKGENLKYKRAAILGLSMFVLLTAPIYFFHPLPTVYYIEIIFGGIKELGIVVLSLLTLSSYFWRGFWRKTDLSYWTTYSVMTFFLSYTFFISSSQVMYDAAFNVGHILMILAQLCFLVGLFVDFFGRIQGIENDKKKLKEKNEIILMEKKENDEMKRKYELKKREFEKVLEETEKSRLELEKMNEMMVGREMKMIELKKEIIKLKRDISK